MRIGVSSRGMWHVSMGPVGWLLTFWIVLPLMAAWYTAVLLGWLCVLTCKAVAERRKAAGHDGIDA